MKRARNGQAVIGAGERRRWVERYRASGMGLKQFAQEHGLSCGQLHYWVYQGARPPEGRKSVPVFREVQFAATALSPSGWSVEVGLPEGLTVRLRPGTDPVWIGALFEILRRPCSLH